MDATYHDYEDCLEIELWRKGSGFRMALFPVYPYEMINLTEDTLTPSIIRYEEDAFLDQYYSLFGPLECYIRTDGRSKSPSPAS